MALSPLRRSRPMLAAWVTALLALPALVAVGPPHVGAASSVPRPSAVTASDWTTFGHDGTRTGVDASGNSFSPASPAWTSPTLDGQLYGQPLVDAGRVFAATENDTVYALRADNGQVLWSSHLGTPLN